MTRVTAWREHLLMVMLRQISYMNPVPGVQKLWIYHGLF